MSSNAVGFFKAVVLSIDNRQFMHVVETETITRPTRRLTPHIMTLKLGLASSSHPKCNNAILKLPQFDHWFSQTCCPTSRILSLLIRFQSGSPITASMWTSNQLHSYAQQLCNRPFLFIYFLIQRLLDYVLSPTPPLPGAALSRPKIAIIGAGLTGVSSAAHCVGHGFDVSLFEAGSRDNRTFWLSLIV
jgi:hypothetical protein